MQQRSPDVIENGTPVVLAHNAQLLFRFHHRTPGVKYVRRIFCGLWKQRKECGIPCAGTGCMYVAAGDCTNDQCRGFHCIWMSTCNLLHGGVAAS